MLELLKDPVAVRVNWLRGGINADSIIAEERERIQREGMLGWVKVPDGKAPMWADLDQVGHWSTTAGNDLNGVSYQAK